MTVSPVRPSVAVSNLDDAMDAVRQRGLRLTSPRRLVLEALFAASGPVSADEIANGLGGLIMASDLTSVYRNLEALEHAGLVRHFHAGHGPGRYVLEGRTELEYVACERCGRIDAVAPATLDATRSEITKATGFVARFVHFPIVGLCADCAAQPG